MDGRTGAAFCIYWSQVSDDSGGPLGWCRPVPEDQAQELAATCPELTLRIEPAHLEAFVELGRWGQISPSQWQLVAEALRAWGEEHAAQPSDLGVRITYLAGGPAGQGTGPDCDSAVPLAPPQ
jgi:hypothetical protein